MLGGHVHKRLISEGGMVDILFEFEESVDRSSKKFRMAQSVSYIGIFLFRFDWYIVFVALSMVIVVSHRSVQSFTFPFDDMWEGNLFIPRGISDEAILVGEGPYLFVVNISAGKAQIWQFFHSRSISVQICVNSRNTAFIGTVKTSNGFPDFSLNLEVILKVVDYGVVFFYFGFIVVLVEFAGDVIGGGWVLVRKCGIDLVLKSGIFLDSAEVGLFFGEGEEL